MKFDLTLKLLLLAIAISLCAIAVHPLVTPAATVLAQPARFDHVFIISTVFLYRGQQGLLVMDRRNGNIWFIPKVNDSFQDPVYVMRMQFEKLDQAPR